MVDADVYRMPHQFAGFVVGDMTKIVAEPLRAEGNDRN